ncbi:unnamed protein product [Rotaria sp. Silwood2]|nr:unnamed protein product [Rotaria sp. Silwood2]CAF4446688.1 unnamed protein product [Rotaria sp. Silwood2]
MSNYLATRAKKFSQQKEDYDWLTALCSEKGTVSATLAQMLLERTAGEIRVTVGYIKFTRRPTQGWHYVQDYWQNNTERVMRALQYKYGLRLQNELT